MSDDRVKDIFVTAAACAASPEAAGDIKAKLQSLSSFLKGKYAHYEVLVVCDERSHCIDADVSACLREVDCIRYIRVFGKKSYSELMAIAFDNAIGDIACAFPVDCMPTADIAAAVDSCCSGNDVVAVANGARSASFFERAVQWLCTRQCIANGFTGLCCASRRAINAAVKKYAFDREPLMALAASAQIAVLESSLVLPVHKCKAEPSLADASAWCNGMAGLSAIASACSLVLLDFAFFAASLAFSVVFVSLSILANELVRAIERGVVSSSSYSVEFEKHSSVMLNTHELNIRSDSVSDTINKVQTGRDR